MMPVRVLHIDDEPDIREIVAMSLGLDSDFTVRGCSSGKDEITVAVEEMPDLIILDVMMPVMDGPSTLAHLRENPRTAGIPVIIMTARAQTREIERFKSLGAAGVIAKPFDPMTLASSVKSHLHAPQDTFGAAHDMFLQRVSRDADALFECWSGLADKETLPSVLRRIRELAHGLAGAGGIFGFPQISDAASELENAAVNELDGVKAPQELERALERLLTSLEAKLPGEPERLRQRSNA